MRPLYKPIRQPELANDGHLGLWFDKFPNGWPNWPPQGKWKYTDKAGWVQAIVARQDQHADLREFAKRQRKLAEACGGLILRVKTEGPFVTGLGRSHPIENGFAWHSTLGLPYLPGSGMKGLARTWAAQWDGASDEDIRRIFGPAPNSSLSVGSVIFCDLLPTRVPKLAADVMTPHYGGWHQGTTDDVPGDYLDPTPIPFLAVAPDQPFQTVVLPRTPHDVDDAARAQKWLLAALENLGAGAKTAAGYGRFIKDEAGEQEVQREQKAAEQERIEAIRAAELRQRMATMTPIRREMEEQGYSDPQKFISGNNVLKNWLDRLNGSSDPAEKREIAELLRDLFMKQYPKDWELVEKGGGKKPGKDKTHDRIRAVQAALKALE